MDDTNRSPFCFSNFTLERYHGSRRKVQIPRFINTDKAPAYGRALALLKREGRCPSDVEHRQIKYRNNVIECDHGKLKRIIGATLGFKSMKTAYATIKGIEVMRALRTMTFAASANCIRYCGGEVVFCDIDKDTYLMDIRKLEAMLKASPRGTYKGIVPVDFHH